MKKLYITEPTAINMQLVTHLLGKDFAIIAGTPTFAGRNLADCTAIMIRSGTTITPTVLKTFPQLRHIIRVGVGVDNIDMDFCATHHIAVYNAPGANADAVSDYIVGMILQALRKTHLLTREDLMSWNRFKFTGRSLADRHVGIVGFGNVGKLVFQKLRGFGCKTVWVYDPFVQKAHLPEGASYATSVENLLRHSDIVTLSVPLLPATRYLINKTNLPLLPDAAIIINASRGGVVNEADVLTYLQHHKLTYIADTVENEPHVSAELLDSPHVVVTPHIASLTRESDDNMVTVALTNFLNKQPMNEPAKVAIV